MYRDNLFIKLLRIGDLEIVSIRKGKQLIWKVSGKSNFISNDAFFIVTSDNYVFNAKQE